MSEQFTHLDKDGNPSMVDIGQKVVSKRTATAQSIVVLDDQIIAQMSNNELQSKKGPVFQTAILAGIMGSKRTSDLIPLCHPIGLDNCKVDIQMNDQNEVVITCTASIFSRTGVEMEALTGATVAALTIYDMCKAFSHNIIIKETRLLSKTGGKRDFKFA